MLRRDAALSVILVSPVYGFRAGRLVLYRWVARAARDEEAALKIEKSKFLAITTVLAAASGMSAFTACTITTTNGGGDAGADSSVTPGTDGSTPTDGSSGDASKPDAAPTCLGDTGPAASCTGTGTNCLTSIEGQNVCGGFRAGFKNDVAAETAKCLALAPTCEAIPDPVESCAIAALAKACPDPAAATPCRTAIAACGTAATVTQARCEQLYAGLNAVGRTAFANCTAEGCGLLDNTCFLPIF